MAVTPDFARELELENLRLEHDATWKTFQAATQHRDLLVQANGGAILLAPLLLQAHLGAAETLLIGDLAACFLLAVSMLSFLEMHSMRLLQHLQAASVAYSRHVLDPRGEGGYFAARISSDHQIISLLRQNDPMGLAVKTAFVIALLDIVIVMVLTAVTAFALLSTTWAWLSFALVSIVAIVLLGSTVRSVSVAEGTLAEQIVRRFRELGALA